MTDPVTDHLEHHGIKGMKWGQRRKVGKNGRVTKGSSDFKSTKDLRKRPSHTLSNMQLKKINERMQLEQKHSQMNPTTITKGHNAAKSILAVAGTVAAAHKFASSDLGQQVMNIGKKAPKHLIGPSGKHFR